MKFKWLSKRRGRVNSKPHIPSSTEHIGDLDIVDLKGLLSSSEDVKIEKLSQEEQRVYVIYCSGLIDKKQLNEYLFPYLKDTFEKEVAHPINSMDVSKLHIQSLKKNRPVEELVLKVFSGEVIVFFQQDHLYYTVDISSPPQRKPEDSKIDNSILGARDCFTEEIDVNVALIRKRLRSNKLCYKTFLAGEHTKKKIGLLYIKDVAKESLIEDISERLNDITDVDIFSSSQVERLIKDTKYSILPLVNYTGRPDFASNTLMHGRFLVLIDGIPTGMMAPANFTYLLNTAEDMNSTNTFVVFERFIRLTALTLSLFLPGFWVSLVAYHQDQLPYTLVATLVLSRQGVPFPLVIEILIMLFLFEVFREAGARLPTALGQTISVVGGLIVGDAAINAGLTAPGILVVVAISVLSTFTLINQGLISTVSVLRIVIIIASAFLGLFGLLVCLLGLILYLANLKSFGVPYLSPISPPVFKDITKVFKSTPTVGEEIKPKTLKKMPKR